jgi:hypothetical protein
MNRPEQEDEQGLREAARDWRSLHLRADESPNGEEIGPLMKLFGRFQKVNSRKLRCIAPFEHLWGSLAEVGGLRVISDFPDYLVIPKTGDASVGHGGSRPIGPSFVSRPAVKVCVRVTQEPR